MNYEEDLELERRLRLIVADPEPEVPASLYKYVDSVVVGPADAGQSGVALATVAFTPMGRVPRRSSVKVMAGLAAALVLAIVGGVLFVGLQHGTPASSPLAPDQWTGLQWQDITATSNGLFARDAWGEGIGTADVVSWTGGLAAIDGNGLWTSQDGLAWSKVGGAPDLARLGSVDGKLIGLGNTPVPCPGASVSTPLICNDPGAEWTSSDGVNWRSVAVPFAGKIVEGFSATSKGVVAVAMPEFDSSGSAEGPYIVYGSSDGISWTQAVFPDDISKAVGFGVSTLREGFLLSAAVPDPAGNGEYSAGGGPIGVTTRSWMSTDGIHWVRAQMDFPAGSWLGQAYAGSLGDDSVGIGCCGYHSTDGNHWVKDADTALGPTGGMVQVLADGRHILVSGFWQPEFSVSLGDGHWRTLDQGGSIGSLPGGGQVVLLPNGVLYAGGGRLFYGRAVSGTPVTGSLSPATTITPPPTPKPTPGTPRPSVTPAPTTGWTGITGIAKLAGGPTGATSITRWKGGYIALRNAPASGGLLTAWTSPDGKTWATIPDGTFGKATSAVCAQDADQVVIATWNGENHVWVSTDGLNWAKAPNGDPPIGDRPMVGNSWGMVAIMDDPQYHLTFGLDWNMSTLLGADVNSVQDVAVAGDRFVAVGHLTTSDGSTKPAAWWSDDGTTWTAATVDSAPGDGFTTVAAGRGGYVATSSATGSGGGSGAFWTSTDGQAWHKASAMGPFPGAAIFTGDGTRILGWGLGSDGKMQFWVSPDGQNWTRLALSGDTASILAAGAGVRPFLTDNGVLFVTADGAWFGSYSAQT